MSHSSVGDSAARLSFAIIAASGIALALGCGGGTSSSAPGRVVSAVTAAPTAPPVPSTTPFSAATVTSVVAPPAGAPVNVAVPSGGGFSGQAALPVTTIATGIQLSQTLSNVLPSGLPALSVVRRSGLSVSRSQEDVNVTAILYLCYTFNADFSLSGNPSFTFTLPSGFTPPGASYFLGLLQGSSWQRGYSGAGTVSGNTVTLTGFFPLSFAGNVQTCFALFMQSNSEVPPTPAPSPIPTSTPLATPTPTSSPGPTASPTPTASPAPSPSPTPTPVPPTAVPIPGPVVVTTGNMGSWAFVNDNLVGSPTGMMVPGPATPPLGTGSAQLSVGGVLEGMMLATPAYGGTMLVNITTLTYSTYQPGPTLALSLQFDVRYHPTDSGYQGRLVFEPYQNGTVTVGSGWQNWNALAGNWWASKTTAAGSNGLCPQSAPCTWSQVFMNWPNASVLSPGNMLFKAGSGWSSFTGNVDKFVIGVGMLNTTYDFGG